MEEEEAAQAATPFAPRASLSRTPPRRSPPGSGGSAVAPTPSVPKRPPPATGTAAKRPLTSPEERDSEEVVRARRTATMPPPRRAIPEAQEEEEEDQEALERGTTNNLVSASKLELLDRVHQDIEKVIAVVSGQTSRLNKEATNTVRSNCQDILAVIAALSIRLGDLEIECGKSRLRSAELEQELLKQKMSAQAGPSSGAVTVSQPSYATTLKLSKKAQPVPIPAAQGPVLAFYPAPEHAEAFKSAEDTKAALKKAIKPQEHQVQVERLRKVGNAGVVVQTTNAASAQRLKQAAPATLRVTEPKRRSPLVSLRHVDGDGDLDSIYSALVEQNFEGTQWTIERLRSQSKLAFRKRGRGTTTVVLECSPQLREALLEKGRVYIGWQVIEVVDFLSVTCCRKCHCYGHPEKYCRSTEVFCGRCGASGHKREECKSAVECCATCKRFNRADAATHATASSTCPARQFAESRSLSSTNYGL